MYKAIIGSVIILMVLFCSSCVQEEKTEIEDNKERVIVLEKDTEQNETTKILVNKEGQYIELFQDEELSIYFANIKGIPEFSERNEGSSRYEPRDERISFSVIKATGTVTGAVDGPYVFAEIDMLKKQVIKKEFDAAPDYDNPKYKEFSGEVLEISNKRLVEIANFFYEIFKNEVAGISKDVEKVDNNSILNEESKKVDVSMISEGYLEEKYGNKILEDYLNYKWLPKSQLTHTLELFYNYEDFMCDDEKEKMDKQILELMKIEKNNQEHFLKDTTVEDLRQGEFYYYEAREETEPEEEKYIKQYEVFQEVKDIGYEIYAREDGSLYLKESSIFYHDYETMKSKQREATIALESAVNVDEIIEIPPHFVIGSAFEILDWYDLSAPRSDWEDTIKIDGRVYHRVIVDYIDNYDEFESYIRSHFSNELINEHNFFNSDRVQNVDNKLYFCGGDRGSDIYMGESRSEIKEYIDNKIVYATYVDYYYSSDLKVVEYTTEYLFIYEKIDGKWVFTRFDYYG